jgi:hypothetical protein
VGKHCRSARDSTGINAKKSRANGHFHGRNSTRMNHIEFMDAQKKSSCNDLRVHRIQSSKRKFSFSMEHALDFSWGKTLWIEIQIEMKNEPIELVLFRYPAGLPSETKNISSF